MHQDNSRTPTTAAWRRHRHRHRQAATLVEMLVAGILLTSVVVMVGPLLLRSGQVRRVAAQRQLALQMASNCLERLAAGESPHMAQINVRQGWDTRKWLPDWQLELNIQNEDSRRRATVSVTWITPAGNTARPVQLTGWLADIKETPR
jgi:type II secretory pathway pseudopilin PulG